VTWQGIDYKLPEDDTIVSKHVTGVIICEIIVHLLVIVQDYKMEHIFMYYIYIYIYIYCLFLPYSFLLVSFLEGTLLVAQLVEALRYKPEGSGFDSRWCH
jgi:hypothetical protein